MVERHWGLRRDPFRPVDPPFQATPGLQEGVGDPILFEQALGNVVENALRYSLMAKGISYELAASSSEVRVSVGNATISSRVEMLQGHLQRIQRDREGTYIAELERSTSGQGRRSMLGLVRICHEANMVLKVAVENNQVTVVASCRR